MHTCDRDWRLTQMRGAAARLLGVVAAALSVSTLLVSICRVQLGVAPRDSIGGHLRRVAPVGCSVRVNTFRRNDLLERFLEHYEQCGAAREIVVVWSDTDRAPPDWLLRRAGQSPVAGTVAVRLELFSVDSLNNRFTLLEAPAADAIFSVDDDLIVSCEILQSMVNIWASAQRQMVGVAPRLVSRDPTESGDWRYLRWWHVWWNGSYSLVLTKVCVLHRDYFDAFNGPSPALVSARKHVDSHRNCEDILMSFVVANTTKAPPLWFRAPYSDYGQSILSLGHHAGISSGVDHIETRGDCITTFARLFGTMPLVTSHAKVVDARMEWVW